jgi:uncharacterized membrane protein
MERWSLQFHAAPGRALLVLLLAAIVAVLLGQAGWCLYRRRWRSAVFFIAAAFGPAVLAAVLAVDAARQYAAGRKDAAKLSAWAAAPLVLLAIGMGLLASASADAVWMAAVAGWAMTAIGAFYATVYGPLGPRRLAALMALRMAAVAALAAVLFKPAIGVVVDPESLKPPLPVLVDRSGSMATMDAENSPTRLAQVWPALGANRGRLESVFRPRWRPFGKTVEDAKSFEAAASRLPTGEGSDGTDIAGAIRHASGEQARSRIPAMLLLSDGIHNGSGSVEEAAAQAGVPIYVVGVGSATPPAAGRRNIKLLSLDAPLDVARDSQATVRATFQVDNLASVPLEVRLIEEASGEVLATAKLTAGKPSATVTAELTWTAKGGAEGTNQATIQKLIVSATPHPAEAVVEDNAMPLHVLVTEPRIGVLYVEGSMRPEYKFLKRLLDSDPQLRLATLVRVSGNRFAAAGAVGGRTLAAIPSGDDDFRNVDVLILGDLDRSFLTDAQMAAIQRFVNRGGGLLMLGGHNSFGPGGYGGTDIEAALPVTMGGRDQPQETSEFLPHLTAAGATHPATAGLAEFLPAPGQPAPKGALPPLAGCVTVAGAKPAATVLMVHPTQRNAAGPLVVLAAQQVGAGRTAAFTADTTWRWDLPMRAMGAASPYQRFWSQLVRYLANAEVKTRRAKPSVLLRPGRTYLQAGESTKVIVRALDEGGAGVDPARLRCTLAPVGGGPTQTLALSPTPGMGVLETTIAPQPPGKYVLRAAAVDTGGKEIASDQMLLVAAGGSAETDRLARDQELLNRIAERSGGAAAELSALGPLVSQIIDRYRNPAQDNPQGQTYRLYHFPLLFGAFVVLLTAEWVFRRRWQLH